MHLPNFMNTVGVSGAVPVALGNHLAVLTQHSCAGSF